MNRIQGMQPRPSAHSDFHLYVDKFMVEEKVQVSLQASVSIIFKEWSYTRIFSYIKPSLLFSLNSFRPYQQETDLNYVIYQNSESYYEACSILSVYSHSSGRMRALSLCYM